MSMRVALAGTSTPPLSLMAATVALLMAALLPCAVGFSPSIYWDVDPRSAQAMVQPIVLGPTLTVWYNVLSLIAATAAMAVHLRLGGRISWMAVALTAAGIAACLWHMPPHVENLRRGPAWITAAAVAMAASHLARHDWPRRIIVAAFIGMLVPMALEALMYIYVQYPLTLEHFRRNEREILQSRGWEYGSSHHLLYKRRLESPDAVGAVGLSNVFGSLVATFSLAGIVAAVCIHRGRAVFTGRAALPALAAVAGMYAIYLTRSKGVPLGFVMSGGVLLLAWFVGPRGRRALTVAVMLAVAAAMAAVLVRGAMGPPPTHEGERSLLFRYHYWEAAASAMADAKPWLGLGPNGFRAAYLLHKNPLNPEEITSAHNVFIDYAVMLGIGGAAWSALLLMWLWRSAHGAALAWEQELASPPPAGELPPRDVAVGLVLAAGVFGTQLLVQWKALLAPESFIAWSFGAIGFIAVTVLLLTPGWLSIAAARISLLAAALMLLLHNQIEMTFFQEGAGITAFVVVGAAGAAAAAGTLPERRADWIVIVMMSLLTLGIILTAALPITRQQAALKDAATALREQQWDATHAALRRAGEAVPMDPDPYFWRSMLMLEQAHQQMLAQRPEAARQALNDALAAIDEAFAAGLDDASLWRFRSQIHERAAEWFDSSHLPAAIEAGRQVIARTPYSLNDHLRMGDLCWRAGDREQARALYGRCIELSEQAYLDPAKQLTDEQRRRVGERLEHE